MRPKQRGPLFFVRLLKVADAPQAAVEGGAAAIEIDVAVLGGGPAGLAAAEAAAVRLAGRGGRVAVFEQRPSVGRKFLMAGKSGLNITHGEAFDHFVARYRSADPTQKNALAAALAAFPPAAVRAWMADLGEESFEGPSGRVFPSVMKASPLLRAWLKRLESLDVEIFTRWRWTDGFGGPRALRFETPEGPRTVAARSVVAAFGGASWPKLGADGVWAQTAAFAPLPRQPFAPSNVGWESALDMAFHARFAGAPLKNVALDTGEAQARGELTVTAYGFEGAPLYTLTPQLRAGAPLRLDLTPDRSLAALGAALTASRGKQSRANWLRKAARLDPVKRALLRAAAPAALDGDVATVSAAIKSVEVPLSRPRPLAEAISTAGGLDWAALDGSLAVIGRPGAFAAGEMIAWDAPTGGYLLTACLALGRLAGAGAAAAALSVRARG